MAGVPLAGTQIPGRNQTRNDKWRLGLYPHRHAFLRRSLELRSRSTTPRPANRELEQRFDFKGTGAIFERDAKEPFVVNMKAEAEFQLKQMLDIPGDGRRGIDAIASMKDAETNTPKRAADSTEASTRRRARRPSSCSRKAA
jgi:hypothetical protein